ncbi:MAG: cytochrome c maturation protein CcmE [Solirubrobacterales bacterium]|jgi:cytochrome c-type biogenesis protein CcmE|nr:cytochrome c maturation protein CcmE [Solirubrobacterales bacterium]
MDPARKRSIRLVVALTAALLLAGGLVYTSFSAGNPARSPSELIAATDPGKTYKLTGKVVNGSITREGHTINFRVRDRTGTASIPVTYTGAVPDPFRDGREVIVTVSRKSGDVYAGARDSLITKCPSKFTAEKTGASPT